MNLRTRIHKSGLVDLGGRIIVCECVPQWFERCWEDFTKTTPKLLLFLFVKKKFMEQQKNILCRCDFWRNFLLSGKSQENCTAEIVNQNILNQVIDKNIFHLLYFFWELLKKIIKVYYIYIFSVVWPGLCQEKEIWDISYHDDDIWLEEEKKYMVNIEIAGDVTYYWSGWEVSARKHVAKVNEVPDLIRQFESFVLSGTIFVRTCYTRSRWWYACVR